VWEVMNVPEKAHPSCNCRYVVPSRAAAGLAETALEPNNVAEKAAVEQSMIGGASASVLAYYYQWYDLSNWN